ncbi:MAG: hypothetical protein KDA79_20410, partial [Planctomycetaceae bacterium]|nr:hypothetical protein [Planctomycetaceae bacterium]
PVCLWNYNIGREASLGLKPVFTKEQQQGTTPLVKQLGGQFTRSFRNLHHPEITEGDYAGQRAIIGNRYKLVLGGKSGDETQKELFDLREDPGEQHDLAASLPAVVRQLEQELREWQQSVLTSLTGADYRQR